MYLLHPIPWENTTTGQPSLCRGSSMTAPWLIGMVNLRPMVLQPRLNTVLNDLGLRSFLAAGRRRNSELLTQVGQLNVMAWIENYFNKNYLTGYLPEQSQWDHVLTGGHPRLEERWEVCGLELDSGVWRRHSGLEYLGSWCQHIQLEMDLQEVVAMMMKMKSDLILRLFSGSWSLVP